MTTEATTTGILLTDVAAFCYAIKKCLLIDFDDERLILAYVLEKEHD